jgi:hypothetical protein
MAKNGGGPLIEHGPLNMFTLAPTLFKYEQLMYILIASFIILLIALSHSAQASDIAIQQNKDQSEQLITINLPMY